MPLYFLNSKQAYSVFSARFTHSNVTLSIMQREEFSYTDSTIYRMTQKEIIHGQIPDLTKQNDKQNHR